MAGPVWGEGGGVRVQLTRQQAMNLAVHIFHELATKQEDVTLPDLQNAQLAIIHRWALRAIADEECRCGTPPADDDNLCAACFASAMLEPMAANRVERIFKLRPVDPDTGLPPGAVKVWENANDAVVGYEYADDD